MSQDVVFQGRLFFYAVIWGGGLMLAYDCLRLLRIFVRHRQWVMAAEEVIFWMTASIMIDELMYRYNSGALSSCIVCGMGVGMVFYRVGVSSVFIRSLSRLFRPLRKKYLFFKTFVKNMGKSLKSVASRRTIKDSKLRRKKQEDHDGS